MSIVSDGEARAVGRSTEWLFLLEQNDLVLNSPMRSSRTLFIAKSVLANKSRVPILSGQGTHNWRFPSMISRSPFRKEGPTPSIPAHLTASSCSKRRRYVGKFTPVGT